MKSGSVERALEAERGRKGFSTEQRDALWKGIDRSIGLGALAPKPEPPAPPAPPAPSALPSAASGLGATKIAALVAIAALGGIGVGALAHAQWAEPRTVVVERSVPAAVPTMPPPLPVPVTAPPITAAPPTATAVTPTLPSPAPPAPATAAPPPVAAKDPALARERNLLDMARTALSRSDAASALTTLETHTREFPKSQLSEEREVLAIQALSSANRLPEARARASAFKKSYPKSALTAVVEEAIQ